MDEMRKLTDSNEKQNPPPSTSEGYFKINGFVPKILSELLKSNTHSFFYDIFMIMARKGWRIGNV